MRMATWENPLDFDSTFSYPGGEGAWQYTSNGYVYGLGINSLDVVHWTGLPGSADELEFDAYATIDSNLLFSVAQSVRRLRWNGTSRTISDDYVSASSGSSNFQVGDRRFIPVAGTTGGSVGYLEYNGTGWDMKNRSSSPTGTLTSLYGFGTAGGLLSKTQSPYGIFAQPAHFDHLTSPMQGSYTYQKQDFASGRAQLDFASSYGYSTSDVQTYDGGLTPSTYTPYFELGVDTFGWVAADDARVLRMGNSYSTANSQRFAYPVDRTRPIMATGRTTSGSAFVVYHSRGLGQPTGVVVGYKNQDGCFND